MVMSLRKLGEIVKDRESLASCSPMGLQRVGHDLVTQQQQQEIRYPTLPPTQLAELEKRVLDGTRKEVTSPSPSAQDPLI